MKRPIVVEESTLNAAQARALLADTRRAVGVMKAAWLHVAINLKKIRAGALYRLCSPAYDSYDDYVRDELKLNKYVAQRMLTAMEYTEEKRPGLAENFERDPESVEVPSYEVVNQLKRVEDRFADDRKGFSTLEREVFDEGIGRVRLKRRVDELFPSEPDSPAEDAARVADADTPALVLEDLKHIERRLQRMAELPEEVKERAYELVHLLQQYV